MNARLRRIAADYEDIKKHFDGHKYIIVEPIGPEPAEKYKITYYINGIYMIEEGKVETLNKHIVIITLHSEYPRYKPLCTIETPIWHPNFKDGQICIGDIWGAGESLSDIIVNIGDMIQYKSWNSYSPLSAAAAKWAIANKHLFPIGNIDLWTGEEVSGIIPSNFDIDIFDEEGGAIKGDESIETIDPLPIEEEIVESESSLIAATTTEKIEEENDFDITADELEGIEFIPTTARMQSSQQAVVPKGGKINFKTIFMKGILYGLIGGFIAWGIAEIAPIHTKTILAWRGHPYDSLMSEVISGKISQTQFYALIGSATLMESSLFSAIIGGLIGAVMGIGEGIYYGSKEKAVKYGLIGLGIALLIGLVGGFLAQLLYSSLLSGVNEYTSEIYLAFVRAIGWSVMGAGVGVAIGLIKPEKMRVINCVLGGIVGGFIGGFLFNFIANSVNASGGNSGVIPRAIGIIIMGALVGLGIGLLEQFAKSAWLKVIRGEFEGKEYLVFQGITSIGNSGKNTIVLFKDKLVAPKHCEIVQEGNKYVLVDKGTPSGTLVNGIRIGRHVLKQGDAISLGNSVLVFNTK
ncbi:MULTISPECIES: FHA domain-containing protein [unclassified Clostridium]|uniref:FHA domain-containing protein n=1 Tax=unclassified Clostridium TaxID=2614128 RepID=UPI00029773EE|nr:MULTISPECIES: FHA domain-containing protein [unclassified Clostridium]EKQ57912.1 MAG: ubiquitin-protein ligase [Clostridium sp. Maddingley MBC34-26]